MRRFSVLLFCGLIGSSYASDNLQQCRAITEASARLQCYDQLADTVEPRSKREQNKDLNAAQDTNNETGHRPVATNNKNEALFGTAGETTTSDITDLKVTISDVDKDQRNKLILLLSNGQRWQQLDQAFIKVKAGDNCVISTAIFGAYTMKCLQGSKSIKVKRIK